MKHQPAEVEEVVELTPQEIAEANTGLLIPAEEVLRRMHEKSAEPSEAS
jgi:hypothetical protein